MGTHELVDEETKKIVFLLWFVPEKGGDESKGVSADICQGVERGGLNKSNQSSSSRQKQCGTHLEDLQYREKVFLQPVLKVPHYKMLVCPFGMVEGLVPEVSIKVV